MTKVVLKSFNLRLIFLCLFPFWAGAQEFQAQFLRYTTVDGLPSNTVYTLTQDDLGYIWMGTANGLCRFDGSSFSYQNQTPGAENAVKGEKIKVLFKDSLGTIWSGTTNYGLNSINLKEGKTKNYQYSPSDNNSLISNEISCIFEDYRGRIWVGAHGLNCLDQTTGQFKRVIPFQDQAALKKYNGWQLEFLKCAQDPLDSTLVWLTCAFGICHFNVETFEAQYYFPQNPQKEPIAFRNAHLDQSGALWLCDWGGGLHRFDTQSGAFELYKCTDNGLDKSCLHAADIFPFDEHRLLLACDNLGLVLFDKNSKQFTPILDPGEHKNIPSAPRMFFADKDGTLWVSSSNNGVYCLQRSWQLFQKIPLTGNIRQAISDPKTGTLYACSDESVLYALNAKGQYLNRYDYPKPLAPGAPSLLDLAFDADMQLWVLGFHELFRFPLDKTYSQKGKIPYGYDPLGESDFYHDFVFDQDDQLWLTAQNSGLSRINFHSKTVQNFRSEVGNPNSLQHDFSIGKVFIDDQNNLWGANAKSFFHYVQTTNRFFNAPNPPEVSDGGRAFTGSRGITQDHDGNIWMSAQLNRIGLIRPGDPTDQPVKIVETSIPLPAVFVSAMLTDGNGDIWIASAAGISRIKPHSFQTEHYGAAYNLSGINNLSIAENGEIIAAMQGGILRFHPDSIAPIAKPPKPIITAFRIFDKDYATGIMPEYFEEVQLSYQQNFFSFEFSALDFSSKKQKTYAYQLEGLEKDWVMAGERRYAAYTNIAGGRYTFKVRVRNESGIWSEPIALHIRIIPPIWDHWWFWTLIGLMACAIIYAIYRYRINQIRKVETLKTVFNKQLAEMEMMALRAQMNPHFLFNSLNAIKFYVLKRSKEKAAEYLTDFARLIRLVLHNSAQQLVTLKQELEALELYVRIELLRFDEQFDFDIKVSAEVDTEHFQIPPLLLQPYVENAIWHGLMHKKTGKGMLLIQLEQKQGALICTIEDNGIGREKAREVRSKSAQRNKSMGLSITRNRMDISQLLSNMQFDVQIEDLMDNDQNAAGTRVLITINTINESHE